MTVRELQNRMDSREFAEWIAFTQLDPFTEERADLRAGIVASTFANANLGKNQQPFKPSDFMPKYGEQVKQEMSPDDIWAKLMVFTRRHNKAQAKKRERGGVS